MKKVILIIFIFLVASLQSFATYEVIDPNATVEQKKYQDFVNNITPEMLGLRPTTDNAEYAKDSDLTNEKQKDANQTRYISEEELNTINLRSIKDQKNDIPFLAKALGILIFGLLIAFIQWVWWFFTEYVPKIQKDKK